MKPHEDIFVRVLDGGRRAEVHIPAGFAADQLTPTLLRTIAAGADVEITPHAEQRLAAIAEDFRRQPRDIVADFTRAVDPVHGTDGRWTWQARFDPVADPAAIAEGDERKDHYASRIRKVAAGEAVATLLAPTLGTDGRSVAGSTIPAKAGRPARRRVGEGLELRPDGAVVAAREGVLHASEDLATVSPVLEIHGCVDFSTGHIEFEGDVLVADAVRDGFRIRATGAVTIGGPVEGAQITCGGDLTCRCGVASARRATIRVDGMADVAFLRNVDVDCRGDLACRGEIASSHVTVSGRCECESARVIGGTLILSRTARIGILGSPEWTPTTVCVGELPLFVLELRRLNERAARIHDAVSSREEAMRDLQCRGGTTDATGRERMTELQYELSELKRAAADLEDMRTRLQDALARRRGGELEVGRIVYPRVTIQHGNTAFCVEQEMKGPLRLLVDERGEICVRISTQTPRPISDFARAVSAIPLVNSPDSAA